MAFGEIWKSVRENKVCLLMKRHAEQGWNMGTGQEGRV